MAIAPLPVCVLVIDGPRRLAPRLRPGLAGAGADVVACRDVAQALAALPEEPFDAVVLDLDDPGAAAEAVGRVVAAAPGADVLVVVPADVTDPAPLRRAGAFEVLPAGPGVGEEVEAVLRAAIDRRAAVVHDAPAAAAAAQAQAWERRQRTLVTLAPVGIIETDASGACTYVNPRWCEMTGLAPRDAWGDGWTAALHPGDRERVFAAWVRAVAAGRDLHLEHRLLRPGGEERWASVSSVPVLDGVGDVVGHLATVTDVTDLKATEQALRDAEERFRHAFEDAPAGMALVGLDGRFLQVNRALCELTGHAEDLLLRTTWHRIVHPDDAPEDEAAVDALLAGRLRTHHREERLLHAAGEAVWVSAHLTVVRAADGTPRHLLAQVLDVTDRRRFEKRLQHMADHDPLTGLLNRRRFEEELDRQVALVQRYGPRGALLVLDLDHFKLVNDTLGHGAGDELIVSVADVLRRRLRATDHIARLGGDEFAVLLPEATVADAERVAEELVEAIRRHAAVLNGDRPRRVTASLGIALFETGLQAGEEVLVNADLAMYDAKEAGRDRVVLLAADRYAEPRMKSRVAWVERIRAALEDDRFVLEAQPIRDLRTGSAAQYELLLRMLDEDGDTIPPGAFLYVAERYDLIQRIDRWVATRAIELLAEHPDVTFEVNVSGKSLDDPELLEAIETGLAESGADPRRLIFEVTETAAVANIHQAREFAERLARLGCRFALDDFGAGFGSFYYLKHLPFDYLKIDGEFVSNCLSSRTDQLVIEAVVAIARGLGKATIAEFVGDEATERFLRGHGVDLAQGFHVGQPMPVGLLAQARR